MEIINSNKFADLSNKIFSEVVSEKKFLEKKRNHEINILQTHSVNSEKFIWYISSSLKINNNDIIYCQTEVVSLLFKLLKKKKLQNLTLITHQSDKAVTKRLYDKKPESITRWFAVNAKHIDSNLFPIPLGINNDYMTGYPIESDFTGNNSLDFHKKDDYIYMNFNVNTRFLQRFHLQKKFKDNKNFVFSDHTLNKTQYLNNLNKYKYVICPWGNGIDTHRIWESIYSNSVPITKKNNVYSKFTSLPIIFVDSYKDLVKPLKAINYEKFSFDNSMVDFNYWKSLIEDNKFNQDNHSDQSREVDISFDFPNFLKLFERNRRIKHRYKKFRYFIFRIYKKFINLLI
tara:strand:+ start:2970 stop:4001 length:1032 start_codon:yes stop_codon:yes gene_type:complete